MEWIECRLCKGSGRSVNWTTGVKNKPCELCDGKKVMPKKSKSSPPKQKDNE